jgi:hypothetical protein
MIALIHRHARPQTSEESPMNNGRILFDPTDTGVLEMLLKKNTREGEEGLMLAVLTDAIEYFQKYVLAKDDRGKKLFQDAEDWFLEKESDWFFSFESICEVLCLHPDYIRQGLLNWKETARKSQSEIKIHTRPGRKKAQKAA